MTRWAIAAAAVLLLTGTAAEAQWRDRGGGDGRGYAPPRYDRGGYGQPRSGYGQPLGDYGASAYRSAGPRGYGGGGGWRRGQVLPPSYRDAYVPDPGRYRLRQAPPGYGWVGDGRNAYLTQRSTGMVLDSVPGAYEPAPAYRGGRRRGPR